METETVKTVKHTPLPWSHSPVIENRQFAAQIWNKEGRSICIIDALNETGTANAEFIVRACNSHYELLEALTGILNTNPDDLTAMNHWRVKGLQAIKKATS
jgi:hypothetical protein